MGGEPAFAAIRGRHAAAQLDRVGWPVWRKGGLEDSADPLDLVGVHELGPGLGRIVRRRHAAALDSHGIPAATAGCKVEVPGSDPGGAGGQAQAFLALAQARLQLRRFTDPVAFRESRMQASVLGFQHRDPGGRHISRHGILTLDPCGRPISSSASFSSSAVIRSSSATRIRHPAPFSIAWA